MLTSKTRVFQSKIVVPAALEEVFDFFSKAENLEQLTPSSLSFKILTPLPIEMKVGTKIDYKLRLLGVPFGWKTEITAWQPPVLFEDSQIKGPYQLWQHTHRFAEANGGTEIGDHLSYRVAGGFLEPIVHTLFVGPQIQAIFAYRTEAIKRIFGEP